MICGKRALRQAFELGWSDARQTRPCLRSIKAITSPIAEQGANPVERWPHFDECPCVLPHGAAF